MGLFCKVSEKELLNIRNQIFLNKGIPALKLNGFEQSPFSTGWYGKDDSGDYSYELCRLSKSLHLHMLFVDIIKGDKWIQIRLNIFNLKPRLKSIEKIKGVDGLQYHLPPNSLTQMRLRIDDYEGMPLFRMKDHKLKSFYSKSGLEKRSKELRDLIEQDLTNIDSFVNRWHELHEPNAVDWEGNKI